MYIMTAKCPQQLKHSMHLLERHLTLRSCAQTGLVLVSQEEHESIRGGQYGHSGSKRHHRGTLGRNAFLNPSHILATSIKFY